MRDYEKCKGDAIMVNRCAALGFIDSRKEPIYLTLLRRTSSLSDDVEACFRERVPFSANVPK